MMKDIKLIALDLDDTTLNNEGKITYNTRAAIEAAIDAGIEVVIASGRSYFSFPEEVKEIPGIKYMICSNGANIYDNRTKEIIYKIRLCSNAVHEILGIANEHINARVDAFMDGIPHGDANYINNLEKYTALSEKTIKYIRKTRIAEADIRSFILKNEENLDCINLSIFDETDRKDVIKSIKALEDVYLTSSADTLLEISDKASGKGAALRVLCDMLKIDLENAAAFGNADNDADMIAYAGTGFAVKNASKSCYEVCDYVTESNQDEGVALAIGEILLERYLRNNKKLAIAFSGGTDSAYLLYKAISMDCDVKAFFVKSQFQPQFELYDAKRLVEKYPDKLTVIDCDILKNEKVVSNPCNRCYFCKKDIFQKILSAAEEEGYKLICDGTNFSDDISDRPGMKALAEYKVESPLRTCCITKAMVRVLSKRAGLFTWNKPSYACLATRVRTDEKITKDILDKIEKSENILHELAFSDFRVRVKENGTIALIELKKNQIDLYYKNEILIKEKISEFFSEIYLSDIIR